MMKIKEGKSKDKMVNCKVKQEKKGVNKMLLIQSYIIFIQKLKEKMCGLIYKSKTDTREFTHLNLTLIQVNRIFNYISCGNWAKMHTREIFVCWLKVNYDYELVADQYRMPVQTVQQLIKDADKALSKVIEKPMQLIISGRVYEGTIAFYQNINKPTKSVKRCTNNEKRKH